MSATSLSLAALAWLAAASLALANGGGYSRGGVARAGAVVGFEPKHTASIRILDEHLTVRFGSEEAVVEVRYRMRNETPKRVTARFGFPVEESADQDLYGAPEDAKKKAAPKGPRYCLDYQASAGGRNLRAKFVAEPPASAAADARFSGIRGWMVSEAVFAGGEEKAVVIRFRSVYPSSTWFVSENSHDSARTFRYRLSTGACWAGTIGRGRIELVPAGIDPAELRILQPVNRFRRDGARWVWEFEDLEPALADDLTVEVAPEQNSYWRGLDGSHNGPTVEWIERGKRWEMAHANYRVKASSTLPPDAGNRYDAANLHDDDWTNAWSEGAPGPGIGAWLELQPEVAKPLTALSIRPGYQKSPELFAANARPKRMRIELNGEHSFHAEIPDRHGDSIRIAVSGYAKPVRTIKLTFEEVWQGSRFEDLCVSGLWLHVRVDKKPTIAPQR
jgi:hypothetical protein